MNQLDTIHLGLPATNKYLNVLAECLTGMLARIDELPERETTIYNIRLAVHEHCTNIIDHAYAGQQPGRINMSFSVGESHLVIESHDSGQVTFDLSKTMAQRDSEPLQSLLQERGRGLLLIHELMDEVEYHPQPGNNRWRLAKNL